ncbi:MAG: hypothetical protein R3E68_03290 [Burkholderiaceae bacterium]
MKLAAGAFLGGAKSRLLPASIPFRFFGAAVLFHLLGWMALLAGASDFPRFQGGLGWPLAALHLTTLGVLTMSVMGASLQLLPVATRQAVGSTWLPAAIWWLHSFGVAAIALGMGRAMPLALAAGAVAVTAALLVFAGLLAGNLVGARSMPEVICFGWASLGSLLVVLISALSLVFAYLGLPLLGRGAGLSLHIVFAVYGFMGLLAMGMSLILIPMFSLSGPIDSRRAIVSCALAVIALTLAAGAAFGIAPVALNALALLVGLGAVSMHLQQMLVALRTGMRRDLGQSFVLVRFGWAMLMTSLLLAMALTLDLPLAGLPTLFGLVLIGGWLLSFLFGILRRVLPFLGSMHVTGRGKRPPTPSSLSATQPLSIHFHCHLVAVAGLALAVLLDQPMIALLSATVGTIGAGAFAVFFTVLLLRIRSNHSSPAAATRV